MQPRCSFQRLQLRNCTMQSRTYHSVPPRLNLFKQAVQHADAKSVAVVSSTGAHEYKQLLEDSATLASALSSHDMDEKSVAFIAPNGYDYVKSQWAIWRAGGIAVPLCVTHPVPELEYTLEDSRSQIVICHDQYLEKIEPLVRKLAIKLIKLSEIDFSTAGLSQAPAYDIDPSRRAMILYTSGTTGKPKGVVTTHEIIESQIKCLVQAWEWSSSDHILHVLPLHHLHGVLNALLCALYAGAKVEMLPKFDAETVWSRFMARDGISLFMAVPTIYQKLIHYYDYNFNNAERLKSSESLRLLRLMVSGSMALPEPVFERWETISGHKLLERFGMTEVGMALSNPYRGKRIPGKVGQPLPNVQVKIRPDDPADPNQGELLIKGPQVFKEYFHRPEATKEAFDSEGWFLTGDSVERDAEGTFRILGRRSVDVLKSGGYKISALDIEQHLLAHPGIAECAVVGLPDSEWGQIIGAVVILQNNAKMTIKELHHWAKERMAPYKAPRVLLCLNEMPRNAMGKVNKKELVKVFETHSSHVQNL